MAATPQPVFTVDGAVNAAFNTTSSRVLLPGATPATDTALRLVNQSGQPVFVALGTATVVATVASGVLVAPGHVATFLGLSGQTYLAGIISGPAPSTGFQQPDATLNIATGN